MLIHLIFIYFTLMVSLSFCEETKSHEGLVFEPMTISADTPPKTSSSAEMRISYRRNRCSLTHSNTTESRKSGELACYAMKRWEEFEKCRQNENPFDFEVVKKCVITFHECASKKAAYSRELDAKRTEDRKELALAFNISEESDLYKVSPVIRFVCQ